MHLNLHFMKKNHKKLFDENKKNIYNYYCNFLKNRYLRYYLMIYRNRINGKEKQMTKQKLNLLVGSIGAFIGIFVFIAYIPQIYANLQGSKAQPFQPLFAAISCLIWVIYGWTKEPKKDWILIIPNSAGVILGGLTFLTAL